ncbi:extracellular solute-binding protein [Paenibacillus sp. FSL R10-2734]|uniref:extracellular solute-binding protein n=1 Tax=Paenibacillus sp. FSL R10-2734 TaxID=2954691 RepID=UPI0030D7CA12
MLRALRRWRASIGLTLALVLVLLLSSASGYAENSTVQSSDQQQEASVAKDQEQHKTNSDNTNEPYFLDKLAEWKKSGATSDHDGKLIISATDYVRTSDGAHVQVSDVDGKSNVLNWSIQNNEWIEYEFNVTQAGLYQMNLTYRPVTDNTHKRAILLNTTMDGKNDFLESKSISLDRHWKDPDKLNLDANGDQVRPMSVDISGWMTTSLRDSGGAYVEPLEWYLTPGKHTLRFTSNEPMTLSTIELTAPEKILDFQTVSKSRPKVNAASANIAPIVLEAEKSDWKSASSVGLKYDNDTESTPYIGGKIRYNSVDGSRWSSGNGEISWSFDVSESGYYKIGLRVMQNFSSNRSTFRTIRINGEIPFSEMMAYQFPYGSGWQGIPITDDNDQPYLFYLEKGTNTISMQVTQAPVKELMTELEEIVSKLMSLGEDLKALTGGSEDTNRTWKMDQDLPGFTTSLQAISEKLGSVQKRLVEVNGRKDGVTQGLYTTLKDIESMLASPSNIPYNIDNFVTMQGKVADYMQQLKNQPLGLDRIYIVPSDQPFPKMIATAFQKVKGSFINFFYSFQAKEDLGDMDESVLNVWVLRGRDYINQLQELADEEFTTQTGIKVKVNLLPDTNLLVLMNAAGMAPDIALGLPQTLPFDYAIRNGLLDLTQFSDFDSVFQRFSPGTWLPFYYNKGYYGIPETQSFSMLYYRKDILDRLGLKVPNTWEDVYNMLPILQQNNMNMMPTQHTPFFYQNGVEYFTPDGMKTGLGTEAGYQAFKEWTDLNNVYAVDQQVASFYQSFRSGTIPIGISDFSMYIQLMVAAPELNGYWGIAPIPGVKQADGQIARWMGGTEQAGVIFKRTKKAEQSWEFLKWWTSADIQEKYGSDLETINGTSFRWNTSNVEAFVHLPWKQEDLNSILEQWRWYKEIPNVPGSYFLDREIQNAWNRTVVDGINYRSSLETAIDAIDVEMRRKMVEFGTVDANGNILRKQELPVVNKPWEGVDKYVEK